jgi:NAD(P) transhydrogenase subunit alpha
MGNLLGEFWEDEQKKFNLDLEDEIIKGCLVTHQGEIFSETVKNFMK